MQLNWAELDGDAGPKPELDGLKLAEDLGRSKEKLLG